MSSQPDGSEQNALRASGSSEQNALRASGSSEQNALRASGSSEQNALRASGSSRENGTANELSRREELLAVATKLFAARGYHGTRINDVADVVGLNKATVYHYYASKSLILFDIYRRAADSTVAAVHDDPSWSAREAIFHFTRRLLANIANNVAGAAVYFQESPYITEWFTEEQVAYIRAAEAAVYEHVRDVIDRGIASGEFYECDSHVLALGHIGMTLGAYRWLRPTGRRSAEEIAVEFSTALLRGLIRDASVREESPLGSASSDGASTTPA